MTIETRQNSRDSMFLAGDLHVGEAGEPVRIKIRNLSSLGLMGSGEVRLSRGTSVVVSIRNIGAVAARVAWTSGQRFGLAFEEPIDPQLARGQVSTGEKEAPVYARPALSAPRFDGFNGKLRRI